MVSIDTFRKIALAFAETTEQPHFNKTSFRVRKSIFATLEVKNHQACIKLSESEQDIFCAFDRSIIFPVPNKWGKQGWTFINLKKVPKRMCLEALTTAYCAVAPAKLVSELKSKGKEPQEEF